jgi:hypothetical protein
MPPLGSKRSSRDEMERYLDTVDRGMEGIGSWDLAADAGLEPTDPRFEQTNRLGRKALSGLYMTAMFSDLSVEDQMHPGMQKRMADSLAEIGETADEIGDYVEARDPAQREATATVLAESNGVAEKFFSALDEHAEANGVVAERREQTRAMYDEVLWRLRNQPDDLVVDEYRNKLMKMTAFSGPELGERREQIARAGEGAFWEWNSGEADPEIQSAIQALLEDQPTSEPEKEDEQPADEQPEEDGDPATPVKEAEAKRHPAARGAKMMGIGLIIFGVSAGLTAAGALPFVFVATVGAIWFLVGLLVLIGDSLSAT